MGTAGNHSVIFLKPPAKIHAARSHSAIFLQPLASIPVAGSNLAVVLLHCDLVLKVTCGPLKIRPLKAPVPVKETKSEFT